MRNLWSEKDNENTSEQVPLYCMHTTKPYFKKALRKKANRRRYAHKTALFKEIEYNLAILMIINIVILATVLLFI